MVIHTRSPATLLLGRGFRGLSSAAGPPPPPLPSQTQASQSPLQPYIPPWLERLLPPTPGSFASSTQRNPLQAQLLASAYTVQQLDTAPPRLPEVAVLGRSNVGKSSLVNYLLGRSSSLAKVSTQPGRTSSINLYKVGSSWCLADCPGYGYARVSKTDRSDWHSMTQAYLKQRSRSGALADVLLLVDASLPRRDMDVAGVEWLASRHFPVTLVFTKCDKKPKRGQPSAADNIASFRQQLDAAGLLQPAQFPTCAVGSERFGRRELLLYLARRLAAHAAAKQAGLTNTAAAVVGGG